MEIVILEKGVIFWLDRKGVGLLRPALLYVKWCDCNDQYSKCNKSDTNHSRVEPAHNKRGERTTMIFNYMQRWFNKFKSNFKSLF